MSVADLGPDFGRHHRSHPTALDIVQREGLQGKLSDKVILITGASSGIGVETARALYHTGAHLFLPVRDIRKGESVKADIESGGGDGAGKIDLLQLDMESLQSVQQCARNFLSRSSKLHILINNAGVMATPPGKTHDGLDIQFGVNYVAHFLLFTLLRPTLIASSTPVFNSRVICLTSSAHKRFPFSFDDLNQDKQPFNTERAYAQSKTAQIYLSLEIERRYGDRGLHSLAVHPGGIITPLQKFVPAEMMNKLKQDKERIASLKTTEQGAATTVWAAVSSEWEGRGGKYLEDCKVAEPLTETSNVFNGYEKWAYDMEAARKLWDETINILYSKRFQPEDA